MPETIILEDGTEKEIPTQEELTALQDKAKSAEELQTEIEKLKSDPQEKNWAAIRNKNQRLEAALKEQGKNIDEEGNITDAPKAIDREEILQEAASRSRQVLLDDYRTRQLSKFSTDDRAVIDTYFNKLSAGESLDYDKIDQFMSDAVRLAHPNQPQRTGFPHTGGVPQSSLDIANNKREDFTETEQGKAVLTDLMPEYKKQ